MAGRRVRRPEAKRRTSGSGCLLQFLVAAVCAVALGYLFGSYLFNEATAPSPSEPPTVETPSPSSEPQNGETSTPAPTEPPAPSQEQKKLQAGSIKLPELAVFQVQVGAFGQKANANRLAGQLKAQGYAVEIVPAGNLTQVRAGAFFGRERADALRVQLTTEQVKPLVVTKLLAGKERTFSAGEQQYYEFVQAAVGTLAETLLAAEEGNVEAAAKEIQELTAAAEKLAGPQDAKTQLVKRLQAMESELKQAAAASGEARAQAVGRALAEFTRWYASL